MIIQEHGNLVRERTNGCRTILVRYLVHMCQSPKVQVVAVRSLVCIQIHPRHEGRTRNRHAPVVERDYSVSIGGVGAVHQDLGVSCRQCINARNAHEAVFGDGVDLSLLVPKSVTRPVTHEAKDVR